jgi:plastocyanin
MRARLLAPAVLTVALALPASAEAADVRVRDFLFSPGYTRIEPGDSVNWAFVGPSTHNVTTRAGAAERFTSGDQQPGARFSHSFATAGRYPFQCTIHPEMRGVVQVGPDTVAPKPTKLKARLGKTSARISFRLPEASKVSATLAAKAKPRKVLRRAKAKDLQDGARSLTVRTSGLAAKRYRVTVRAVDPEGNVATAAVALRIPAEK